MMHLALHQFLKIKFYWNTAMPIHVHMVYGDFRASTADWNVCDGDHVTHEASNVYYLAL